MNTIFTSSTQYGDLKGNISIDSEINGDLHEFAKKHGVNTDKYFPVGIDIFIHVRGTASISILAVDFDNLKQDPTYDNLKQYLEENEEIDIIEIDLNNATFEDYLKECKRVNIVATSIPGLLNHKINKVGNKPL